MNDISIFYTDSKAESIRGVRNGSDISDIVENLTISTSINGGAGRAELEIIGDGSEFNFGGEIRVIAGGVIVFRGFLFSVSMSDSSRFSATFYDQTRYLRNNDIIVYKKKTASDLFKTICKTANVEMGTVDPSSAILPNTAAIGRAYWDMLTEAIDYTAAFENKLFIVRDNAGALEFRDIENLRTDFVIDDEGIAIGFDYTIGIDQNTFNQVKIGFEGNKKRNWGIVNDSDKVNEWGLLQYFQILRDKTDEATLKKRCEQQLALLSKPTRELHLNCFGDWRISSGSGVGVSLESVMAFKGMHNFYVSSCSHHVSNDVHTMDLTLAIDNFGGSA